MRSEALLLPLGSYLFVTLGLPLLNGAAAGEGFGVHALSVALLAVGTVLAIAALLRLARRAAGR